MTIKERLRHAQSQAGDAGGDGVRPRRRKFEVRSDRRRGHRLDRDAPARPLADYYAAAADLVRRIAVGLHVLDHAARKADRLSAEVGKDAVQRAVTFVEQCVLPTARSALRAASVAPEVRNGRRILSYAKLNASVARPNLALRDIGRILNQAMPTAADFDCAIDRLFVDKLLTPSDPEEAGGGHAVRVVDEVFLPDNRLPDLVTDPRRPKE